MEIKNLVKGSLYINQSDTNSNKYYKFIENNGDIAFFEMYTINEDNSIHLIDKCYPITEHNCIDLLKISKPILPI